MRIGPVPEMPPLARIAPVTGAIAAVSSALSLISCDTMLRIIGYVQPRSSYGLGFAIE